MPNGHRTGPRAAVLLTVIAALLGAALTLSCGGPLWVRPSPRPTLPAA